MLLARDHGDWVGGVGVNGALGDATWNLELVPTFLSTGPTRVSALANISDAITLFDRNATVFAEYFHNGFGAGGGDFDLASLPPDLIDRLGRGQLFDTRRDYLAGGVTLEVDPLFTLNPTLIANLNDFSLYRINAEGEQGNAVPCFQPGYEAGVPLLRFRQPTPGSLCGLGR